ncbi:phage tail protein [Xenorhabdus bovienii]|uniref:phage tail protein n=1 Tax=Xenorhabdus bovienii TaxID=40576 RepID=UPI001EE1001D|nr:phage tail protein [Xenorhabdus bovienii]MCG3461556.1 phage tail protein [Xenorhabdus bovienii]
MAKNEFLPFGIADGANVLSNDEYGNLAARTNGFSSGVAKSQELNKVWRQASVIASVVAQFIAKTNNQDVLDDGNTEALRAGLLNALRATVGANIPVASQTVAGIAKLSNATNSEAENVAATPKAVKQAADMANQARTEAGNANATANTANQNAGNAITNANTANQNASNANENANSRLEKNQNGADILDPKRFVENLGFIEQQTGRSATTVMSQAGATQAFALKQSREAFKSGSHTIVSDNEYAYVELINSDNERLSLESIPSNKKFSGNIILRNPEGKAVSVIKIPRQFDTTLATSADLTGYQPAGNYATNAALSSVENKSVQAVRYGLIRTIKTAADNWTPAADGEFIIGIRTSFDGAGTWIITDVKVATLQTFADGKWVNIQHA